jgi:adenylate cyclase
MTRHWYQRHPLLTVGLAPLLAVMVSVVFNVWYGVVYIEPLLTHNQYHLLLQALLLFNLVAFPLAGLFWGGMLASLGPGLNLSRPELATDHLRLARVRARAINLPWHFAGLVVVANILVGWVLWRVVTQAGEPVYGHFDLHLMVAIGMAALITVTIAFFLIEILVSTLLLPLLFPAGNVGSVAGALPLSLPMRAVMITLAGGIGPIVMLLLIGWADDVQKGAEPSAFRLAVGLLGVGFALITALLFGRLVVQPIRKLNMAAQRVASGNLATEVRLHRADEFGLLADEFNRMVAGLREKQRLRETFGLHVGEYAAEQIMARDPGLGGQRREITVMFCDIRGFTAISAGQPPEQVVARLNQFLEIMVGVVETRHGGMVNKYLGDGFMALFGASGRELDHAAAAVSAAREMLSAQNEFRIGIGIHTGPAIVGTIGSPRRHEFTAIGDTVNLAARLESLTKTLDVPLLFGHATRSQLGQDIKVRHLGAQAIRGQPGLIEVYSLDQ